MRSPSMLAAGEALPAVKGGWLGAHYQFTSAMAQNFWLAIVAWSSCFIATIAISLATTRTKTDGELKGLVYYLTDRITEENEPAWKKPAVVGTVVLLVALALNILFW